MHELTLAENIVDLAEQAATAENCGRVKAVHVEIGELSMVDVDALCFAFDIVTRASTVQGAQLCIRHVAGEGACEACGAQAPMSELAAPCPACGSYRRTVVAGQAMRVIGIELEG